MNDERRRASGILGRFRLGIGKGALLFGSVLIIASAVAWLPEHAGLTPAGRSALFILLFAGGLWVTEAIPAFAVAVLILSLEIAILGRPGGVYAQDPNDWQIFVRPWSSPIIWLFMGGFILAAAAAKTGLDRWFSILVLRRCGTRPATILLGIMAVTFCFSMFISNTATTAMMMAVTTPILASVATTDPFRKALTLAVPFAANIGGMGTVIGSPPNAIAIGTLQPVAPLNFLDWMFFGLPPALVLFALVWAFLVWKHPTTNPALRIDFGSSETDAESAARWKKLVVMITFFATVGLWLTEPLHHIPSPVVSFLPIMVFTVFQIVGPEEIRGLPWDVLLLVTGGLALGVAVAETGLATWMLEQFALEGRNPILIAALLALACSIFSNFMSNTAAANILIPIGIAVGTGVETEIVIPIALAASTAMCLPVSTPPNAIAFSQGHLSAKDFIPGGLAVGLLAPFLCVWWARIIAG